MKLLFSKNALLATALLLSVTLFSSCRARKPVVPPAQEPVSTQTTTPTSEPAQTEADSDNDGIVDSKDNCPNKAGSASNNGCPEEPVKEIKAEPTFNYKNILFEFNSSVLKTSSYPILDEIAREMKKYPEMSFTLNGHSSAEGSLERNMTLSNDRATAVKAYLVGLGISSANLEVKAFGESSPIASNDTESGRQLNRRVEIRKK